VSDYPWLDPHLDVVSTVIVVATAAVTVWMGLVRAPRLYRALVVVRENNRSDLARRYYRRATAVQALRCVVVLLVLVTDRGVSRVDLGLVLPSGRHAPTAWGWFAYVCVLLALVVVVLRVRVRRGQSVPGQGLFSALVARDGERWLAAGVAVGAGVSEELLFRGLFLAAVVSGWGLDPVVALIIVSVVFGAMHRYQGWLGVLGTAVVSLMFGGFYLTTRSLLIPILIHVLVDLRGLVAVPVATGAGRPRH
jgi:membrane protease YdiL (CAAX protease family)